jgi:hypothetical protein
VVLNEIHCLPIQLLNALPDLTVLSLMVGKVESGSPVTKITRKYEDSFRIIKILSEDFPITIGHLFVHWTCHDWNELDIFA